MVGITIADGTEFLVGIVSSSAVVLLSFDARKSNTSGFYCFARNRVTVILTPSEVSEQPFIDFIIQLRGYLPGRP
jgi:hypothetical protein